MYGRGHQTVSFGPPVTPDIVKYLLIANVAAFVGQVMVGMHNSVVFGGVVPALFWQQGYLWQPLTYMWLHGGLLHLGMNMFALWMFGSPLAMLWGDRRFLRFYLICGVGAGLVIAAWPLVPAAFGASAMGAFVMPTVGASGAVFGVLLGYSLTWPDRTIMLLFPPIPIKAIWFIPLILGISLLSGGNVSHAGHLGGVLVGYILLRRMGISGGIPTLQQLKYRWRRYRMRQKLRAVRMEEQRSRQRENRWFH